MMRLVSTLKHLFGKPPVLFFFLFLFWWGSSIKQYSKNEKNKLEKAVEGVLTKLNEVLYNNVVLVIATRSGGDRVSFKGQD